MDLFTDESKILKKLTPAQESRKTAMLYHLAIFGNRNYKVLNETLTNEFMEKALPFPLTPN